MFKSVEETILETVELETGKRRAEEFENKYLRVHAEMQNIQRRAKEERQQLQKYRSQDLAKAILPSLDNIERALAVEGLTDDVKKGLEMIQESLINALKEEGIEEIAADGEFDHNFIWLFKPCLQMMSIRRIPSHKSSRKATNSMTASYAQPW